MSSEAKYWPNPNVPQSTRRGVMTDEAKRTMDEIQSGVSAASTGMTRLRAILDQVDNPPTPTPDPTPNPPSDVIRVRSGENLQAAIDQAASQGGIVQLRLEPRATFAGNYVLPTHKAGNMVLLRPDFEDANLPPTGRWVEPDNKDLPILKSADNINPIVRTRDENSNSFAFMGLRFDPLSPDRPMVFLGTEKNGADKQPRGFIFDRNWFRGDPVYGQHAGIIANAGDVQVFGNYMENFFEFGRDCQCIISWAGPGGHEYAYNFLEASAENVMWGGSFSVTPGSVGTKLRVHHNFFTKDFAWATMPNPAGGNIKVAVKNLFELKNARDVVFEYNIMEHCWKAGQDGYAFVFTPTSHRDGTGEDWVTVSDVMVRNNVIRQVGACVQINNGQGGRSVLNSAINKGAHAVTLENNLFCDVNNDPRWLGAGKQVQAANNDLNPDGPGPFAFRHNTVVRMAKAGSMVFLYGSGTPTKPPNGRMQLDISDNTLYEGTYGIVGGSPMGMETFKQFSATGRFAGNVVEQGSRPLNYADNLKVPAGTIATEVDPVAYTLKPGGKLATAKTTDGKPVGCDVSKLPLKGLF